MITKPNIFLFFFLCGLLACSPPPEQAQKEVNPFEAAMPHGAALPTQELTEKDKENLAAAKGRMVDTISIKQLNTIANEKTSTLKIFNFWKLDCADCLSLNTQLQKIEHKKEGKIELILINLDNESYTQQVNTYIRVNNITTNVYQISDKIAQDELNSVFAGWNNLLPVFFIKNNADGIDLNYQKKFSEDELLTLLETLLL